MSAIDFGGGGEIRTLASLTTTNGLANRPLQPLGYSSVRCGAVCCDNLNDCSIKQRRGLVLSVDICYYKNIII